MDKYIRIAAPAHIVPELSDAKQVRLKIPASDYDLGGIRRDFSVDRADLVDTAEQPGRRYSRALYVKQDYARRLCIPALPNPPIKSAPMRASRKG